MEPVLEIAEGAASHDPDTGLRAVAALRALAERLEILQVQNARERGWSWQEIAGRLHKAGGAPQVRPTPGEAVMLERFTPDARAVLVPAQHHARRLGHNFIGGEHILLAVVSAGHPAGAILGAHGVTAEYVEAELVRLIGLGRGAGSGDAPLGGLDREALASIGIDLDTVRAR